MNIYFKIDKYKHCAHTYIKPMNANGSGLDLTSHIVGSDPSPRQLPIHLSISLFIFDYYYGVLGINPQIKLLG